MGQKLFGKLCSNLYQLFSKESEYNRACFESICGNKEEALRLLKISIEQKQANLEWVQQDPDFFFIRDDPRFNELVGSI